MCPVRVFPLSFNRSLDSIVFSIYDEIWPGVFDGDAPEIPNRFGKVSFEDISPSAIDWLRVGVNRRNQSVKLVVHRTTMISRLRVQPFPASEPPW